MWSVNPNFYGMMIYVSQMFVFVIVFRYHRFIASSMLWYILKSFTYDYFQWLIHIATQLFVFLDMKFLKEQHSFILLRSNERVMLNSKAIYFISQYKMSICGKSYACDMCSCLNIETITHGRKELCDLSSFSCSFETSEISTIHEVQYCKCVHITQSPYVFLIHFVTYVIKIKMIRNISSFLILIRWHINLSTV